MNLISQNVSLKAEANQIFGREGGLKKIQNVLINWFDTNDRFRTTGANHRATPPIGAFQLDRKW
jgi:hypothetical protein